jgi:hypothetical protein
MSPGRNEQAAFAFDAHLSQLLQLGVKGSRIDYDAVTDDTGALVVEDAGRNKSQDELTLANADGMTGIVSALISGHQIEMRREYVDDLTLAFIAPLGPNYDDIFHLSLSADGLIQSAGSHLNVWRSREEACAETNLQAHTA